MTGWTTWEPGEAERVLARLASRLARQIAADQAAEIEADLWPLAMSGIPRGRITVAHRAMDGVYLGIRLDGEWVIDRRKRVRRD